MKITRGDQIEIGDRVLIDGIPFLAHKVSDLATYFRAESHNQLGDYRIPFDWSQSMKPDLSIKMNTEPKQQATVKVENEADKKVQIEKVGEVVCITIY